eukprot:TRINITY_DN122_c0_g1_i1.p1 TRINITY_DN122_c0_g1~~TRINITY_DN122_c0_g1_i1.p1  ORF type:complete len:274 (-),score=61.39 TRINITY_DN122_c0_g1_i1:572-1393(-)
MDFLLVKLLSQEHFSIQKEEEQKQKESEKDGDENEEGQKSDHSSKQEKNKWRIISVFVASPSSFLFHTFTPDVFFLTLSLLSLFLIGQRRYILASIFIFIAMFVSTSAIVFLFIMLWELIDSLLKIRSLKREHQNTTGSVSKEEEIHWKRQYLQVEHQRKKDQQCEIVFSLIIIILSVLAFFRFYLFKYWDKYAFFDAMKNEWSRRLKNPFETLFFGFLFCLEALMGKHYSPGKELRNYLMNASPWNTTNFSTDDQWESFYDCSEVNQRPPGY